MIHQPNELKDESKKIRMLIAGYPGIGKSTLALSAPNPLHIDVDHGLDRVEAQYRKAYIQPNDYEEILTDLVPQNLTDFDTLVFDTGGKLVTLIGMYLMKKDPKYAQRDGSLSLKGYGAVGREFTRFMDYCFYELKKHVVIIFHTTEEKDGDATRLRIKVEGQTRNNVWENMDLGGFMEMNGDKRTIGFSNCEKYYAKGTRGVHGVIQIPTLTDSDANDFLTRLFAEYNKKTAQEISEADTKKEAYAAAMEAGKNIISGIKDAETATAAIEPFKAIKHALSSKKELGAMLKKQTDALGLVYDKAANTYKTKETANA